jgi:uncharacterized protein with HEPN domain
MSRADIDRLIDAREYARHAVDSAGGLSSDILAEAIQPQHAALYDLIIIGEALNKVTPEIKAVAPNLPWKAAIEQRNVIVHGYWQIDLEIIADVIKNDLEPLIAELDKLIEFVARMEK